MAQISTQELLIRLSKGKPIAAVLLLGDEPYLRDTCRAALIEKLVPEAARVWAVSRFSAERGEVQAAVDQAQTLPMLSPQQVVFLASVEAIEKLGDDARDLAVESLRAYFVNLAPFTTLVLEAVQLDQRMKLSKLLMEETLVVTVGLGEDSEKNVAAAVKLAQTMAADIGVKLDAEAADNLAEWTSGDLMGMKTELEKLTAYVGERRHVRREDVALLVVSQKKYTVWQMAEMIASRQPQRALEYLDRLIAEGEEPVRLVGAMAWMYRKLIEAGEIKGQMNGWQASRALGMNPKMAELAMQSAKKIPREKLLEGLEAMQECDDRLKSGNTNPRAVLDFLISRLTAGDAVKGAA